jgi:anti-sigma-K factor RskA
VGPTARLAIVALAAAAVVVLFLAKQDVDRYVFAAPVLVAGLTIALAKWNDL